MSDMPPPPPPPGNMPPPPSGGGGVSAFGPLASWGDRAIAALVNFVPLIVLSFVIGLVSNTLASLITFAAGIYFYYLDGETGAHPGKRVMGLKTVNMETGQPIGGGMGIVRYFAHIVDSITCFIGYLFPLWDENRQTFADKIMKTVVLKDQPKQAFGPEIFKP
ncbi:RDD family protein [Actinospongicola halichondriae]|uniref:RDD family protein n=1 Tax=Actinospongicola halichondriae TaxID=3236844 RepID=UPI003D3FC182